MVVAAAVAAAGTATAGRRRGAGVATDGTCLADEARWEWSGEQGILISSSLFGHTCTGATRGTAAGHAAGAGKGDATVAEAAAEMAGGTAAAAAAVGIETGEASGGDEIRW